MLGLSDKKFQNFERLLLFFKVFALYVYILLLMGKKRDQIHCGLTFFFLGGVAKTELEVFSVSEIIHILYVYFISSSIM